MEREAEVSRITTNSHSCKHPLFAYLSTGAWDDAPQNLDRPCVFVFERSRLIKPTKEQIEKYRADESIVKSHGGLMLRREYEIGGEAPVLSRDEVEGILAAVTRDNPEATIVAHWNGEGCYTMSVAVDFKYQDGK